MENVKTSSQKLLACISGMFGWYKLSYCRYFIILALLFFTLCPVSSTSNNESFVTSSSGLENPYSVSGNVFSNVQNKTVNASHTNVVIQGNGMKGIIKCDDYGNYKFGDLDNYNGLEYGNYSLIAFKYIPSEGKYVLS
ncbi:hypothetical protein [Methanosarcina acetivorans]|nr:hypothetical protein [Methanosarcina acetivorans]